MAHSFIISIMTAEFSAIMQYIENSKPLELAPIFLQDVGMDLVIRRARWLKARPDCEILFWRMDELDSGAKRR